MSVNVQVHVEWFPRRGGREGTIALPTTGPVPPTAAALLALLDVAPDSVLIVRGDTPIPLDAALVDGESLRIILTVSGG